MATRQQITDYRNSPVAWFCVLERERERNNFERAAEAVRELKRLGVTVKFRSRTAKKLSEAERSLSKRLTVLGAGQ
jgi:hypothetical protein